MTASVSAGTSYDKPDVAQIGIGWLGLGVSHVPSSKTWNPSGGASLGPRVGLELARFKDYGSQNTLIGHIDCQEAMVAIKHKNAVLIGIAARPAHSRGRNPPAERASRQGEIATSSSPYLQ